MVKTENISIDPKRIDVGKIGMIVSCLKKEGVIAYPTDTFYGLGVNCYSKEAVEKVFILKGRDMSKPLPVVISDLKMLPGLVENFPVVFESLADSFWPGPLTLIFRASDRVPGAVLGGAKTIGVRYPDFSWLQALIHEAGFPLTATSANLSAQDEIRDVRRIIEEFYGKIDMIVDGGPAPGSKPSTVVDISSGRLAILREGAIPASAFQSYLT